VKYAASERLWRSLNFQRAQFIQLLQTRWLDASDRVVRLHSTLPTEDPIEFVATYSGWGRQSVILPARAETATLPYTFR